MAVASVEHFVEEGVSLDGSQRNAFVQEGIAPNLIDEGIPLEREFLIPPLPLEVFERAGKEWDLAINLGAPVGEIRDNFEGINKALADKDVKEALGPERPGLIRRGIKKFGRSFVNILMAVRTKSEIGKLGTELSVFSERIAAAKDAGLMPEDGGYKEFLAISEEDMDELFGGQTILEHVARKTAERAATTPGLKATDVPPALTIPEKATDVVANVSAFITKLAIAKQLLGAPASGRSILAWETVNMAEGGIPGTGAAMYVSLRGIDKIPIKGAKGFFVKTGSQSALFAGTTAVAGGDAEAIATAALLPWALRGFDLAVKTGGKISRVKLEKKAVQNLRDFGAKNGIDVTKVPDSALKFLVGKARQARFWNKQFDKGKISAETHDMRLNQIRQEVAPVLGAIAKQQAVPEAAIVKAEPVVKKPAPEPTVKPTAAAPVAKPIVKVAKPGVKPAKAPEGARNALFRVGEAQLDVEAAIKKHGFGGLTEAEQHPELTKAKRNKEAAQNELFDSLNPQFKIGDTFKVKGQSWVVEQANFDVSKSADTMLKTGFPSTFAFFSIDARTVDGKERHTFFHNDLDWLKSIDTAKALRDVISQPPAEAKPGVKPAKAPRAEERVVVAVVKIGDELFEGITHAEAVEKAIDAGIAQFNDKGILEKIGEPGAEIASDLFKTSTGQIVDRIGAGKITGGKLFAEAIETIKPAPEEKAVGFADPKTTRPGSTTLINDAAIESVTIARDLTDTAIKSTKASSNLLKRNVAKAIDHIATLGSGGTRISKDMDDIAFKAQRNSNVDLLAIKKGYGKMSHADRVKVSKLMNGYIKESEVSQEVAIARDAILDVLDRGMHEANTVGIRRKVSGESLELKGVGKAAPQVLNRKGIKFFRELDRKGIGSQAVLQVAEQMIETGQATSIEDAVTKLQQFRDSQLRGINPYFERTRIELPEEFIEWDGLNTLPRLLEKNWLTIEGVRKWGWDTTAKSFPKANVAIEVIRKEFGEKEADRIQRFISASFLGKTTASLDSQQLSQAMRDYQFITKIALSPVTILRNMADRLPKGQAVGGLLANIDALKAYPPVLNNFIEGSRRIEKNIIKSGAAFGHTAMAEDFEAGTQVKNIIGLPFSASELGNQIHIALVRKFQMERDINSLIEAQGKTGILYKAFDKLATVIGGSQKQVKNRLRELGNEELIERLAKGEELNGDLLDAVLHRTVRDKTFPILLSTKPIWWDNHPWARAAAQFKTWPVRQTQHIWNDVIKYTIKTGDISRMVRFLIATAMVGEVYNIARDFLTDRREALTNTLIDGKPQKDVVISLLNAFFDGGGIGILADFTYGFTDWLIGPSGSTVKNVRDTVARIYKEPDLAPQAVIKAITKEVQPVKQARQIINQVDREHFNRNNITKQYAKWRAEGYKWARQKRAPTVGKKIKEFGDDFLFGKRQFRPGDDSLALEMAARQVMVGDLDDAADYIRLIIKRASTPEEIAEAFTKIQVSMKSRAPLGKVAEQDLGLFMEPLSDEDKEETIRITAVWFKNYADAIQRAIKKPEE